VARNAEGGPGIHHPKDRQPTPDAAAATRYDTFGFKLPRSRDIAWYATGLRDGIEIGRQLEAEGMAARWAEIAGPIAMGGPAHADLELLRWGPAGRAHFGDPRPGDYHGRGGEAA
jgi:hypothetical protein